MQRWPEAGGGRRRTVFALAALAHVALVGLMWHSRMSRDRPAPGSVVEATIWQASAAHRTATPLPAPHPTRLRAVPHARLDADPHAIRAPALAPPPLAQAASAPTPAASAASQALDLTLTRQQLRALVAGSKPTFAQSLAQGPKPSALARLGGDDAPYEEAPLPGGVTEVHVHGGCFRLVPTPRAQYDPFNHANERLMAACK